MKRFWIATLLASVTATPALAVHNDVLIGAVGGKLTGGSADLGDDGEPGGVGADADNYALGALVFEGELNDTGVGVWEGDEPGVNAISQANHNLFATGGSALPASADLNFTLKAFDIGGDTRNLWYWDGSGPVAFGAPPTGAEMTVFDVFPFATVDGSATDVSAIAPWATTAADGSLHQHRLFQLIDVGNPGVLPAAGVYVIGVEFGMTGLTSSDILMLVLNAGLDEEDHEAAVEFIENLNTNPGGPGDPTVPEPASALAMVMGLAAIGARRQRRE